MSAIQLLWLGFTPPRRPEIAPPLAHALGAAVAANANGALIALLDGGVLVAATSKIQYCNLGYNADVDPYYRTAGGADRRTDSGSGAGGGALRKSASRHACHGKNGRNDQKFLHDKHSSAC